MSGAKFSLLFWKIHFHLWIKSPSFLINWGKLLPQAPNTSKTFDFCKIFKILFNLFSDIKLIKLDESEYLYLNLVITNSFTTKTNFHEGRRWNSFSITKISLLNVDVLKLLTDPLQHWLGLVWSKLFLQETLSVVPQSPRLVSRDLSSGKLFNVKLWADPCKLPYCSKVSWLYSSHCLWPSRPAPSSRPAGPSTACWAFRARISSMNMRTVSWEVRSVTCQTGQYWYNSHHSLPLVFNPSIESLQPLTESRNVNCKWIFFSIITSCGGLWHISLMKEGGAAWREAIVRMSGKSLWGRSDHCWMGYKCR